MPWWCWLILGLLTGGIVVYVALGLYLGGAFRR
jgi:hypothetical protein